MMIYVTAGSGRTGQGCADPRAAALGQILGVTNIDGSIPGVAWFSFCSWFDAIRRGSQTLTGLMSWGLTATKLPEYTSHKKARDWGDSNAQESARSTAERHVQGYRATVVSDCPPVEQTVARPARHGWGQPVQSYPEALEDAQAAIIKLLELYGEEQVLTTARALMAAPKRPNDISLLANPGALGCTAPYIVKLPQRPPSVGQQIGVTGYSFEGLCPRPQNRCSATRA